MGSRSPARRTVPLARSPVHPGAADARGPGYAVVDVETTGFRTSEDHRVIEIAVVHLDPAGEVTGEWATLVNPERGVGPEDVHGITAEEALLAPTFERIAGTVAGLLRGRIVAGHNLPFDARFLTYEFARAGVDRPVDHREGVCTMSWAAHFLRGDPRTLPDCCAAAGVPLDGHHEALSDARAAAGLLRHYIAAAGPVPPWHHVFRAAARVPWPDVPGTEAVGVRRRARRPFSARPGPL
ncbi:3'-5' exonuclease [Sphaerisporangium fuscum]|uniref:3'-5' exonuclease n=1 Tax=Sphaerisporangium fuscum TaxID=2835868 RepID=UPI001BDBB3F8|nr:3'-5' exonuclease [Sphaerisporangium fuscum]